MPAIDRYYCVVLSGEAERRAMQGLVDRQAIVDLMTRYGACIDSQDWTRWEGVFADDVVIDYPGGHYEGRRGLAGWLRHRMRAFPSTQHLMGSSLVEIDGDRAHALTYMQAVHVRDPADTDHHFDTGGWYDTDHIRTADGWRIQRLRLTRVWTAGEPAPTPKEVADE